MYKWSLLLFGRRSNHRNELTATVGSEPEKTVQNEFAVMTYGNVTRNNAHGGTLESYLSVEIKKLVSIAM